MDVTELYENAPFNPDDPNPWLALYLDASLPLSDEVKAVIAGELRLQIAAVSLPLIRPLAKLTIMFLQIIKIVVPNKLTSSRIGYWLIYK